MAHELDRNAQTGKAAMFSVRLTPWHHEGVVLNEAPDFEAALKLAGVDYVVAMRPAFVPDGAGGYMEVPGSFATIREDRNLPLSIVGNGYRPLQNRDAFEVLVPLLDKGLATLETGGTLREGADAWMMVKFAVDDPVVKEVFANEVVPFGLISNNHTCGRRAQVQLTPVRVVCANTLGMAHAGATHDNAVMVRHVGNARIKVVEAAERMFAGIVDRYRTVAEQYRLMKETRFTVDQFTETVLNTLAPLPKVEEGDSGRAMHNAETKRAALTEKWRKGAGHTGDESAWEAYNGAVEEIDHDGEIYKVKGSRVLALVNGRLGSEKEAVLESVIKECRRMQTQ
jgi:phage/plasmid-like protein (TIGR03299 family)